MHSTRNDRDGKYIAHDGARFFFRTAGHDRAGMVPLVLVHGLGMSSAYWRRVQTPLAATRPVYALDLPGFGHSSRPHKTLDIPALAVALHGWMTALDLPPVHLVGHSLGGQVVAEFARVYPACVARLVLAGATTGTGAGSARHIVGLAWDGLREPPSLFPTVLRAYMRAGVRRIIATDRAGDRDDTLATAAHLAMPMLIIRGECDGVVSSREAQRLLVAAPSARYVEIPGASHALQWSRPDAFVRAVNQFLAEDGETIPPASPDDST